MFKNKLNLRNVVTIAICLAGVTMFSGCDKDPDPIENPPVPKDAVELTSPITENTTLKDLGLPIDYYFNGATLEVKNNAILTIEDSVTIQFRKTDGNLVITDGATIKALGSANKRIQLIGATNEKGAWSNFTIETMTNNELKCVDILNGGGLTGGYTEGSLTLLNGRAGLSHCKISGSKSNGLNVYSSGTPCELSYFDNNVVENCNVPVSLYQIEMAEHFNLTSNLTSNTNKYISVANMNLSKNLTLNATTVPYYLQRCDGLHKTFTVEEGVTFYMADNSQFRMQDDGVLLVNGTAEKPVLFTRLPNSAAYWCGIFGGYGNSVHHTLNHCIIEYGGGTNDGTNDGGNLILWQAGITLNNVEFRNSMRYGIFVHTNTSVNHSNVTFSNNALGNVRWHDGLVYDALP
jgi:hypothetical protein